MLLLLTDGICNVQVPLFVCTERMVKRVNDELTPLQRILAWVLVAQAVLVYMAALVFPWMPKGAPLTEDVASVLGFGVVGLLAVAVFLALLLWRKHCPEEKERNYR